VNLASTSILILVLGTNSFVETPPEPSTILGGEVVAPCGWPNVVSVGGFCSGTLIHPEVVLYAAHCGDQVDWIRFGDTVAGTTREVVPDRCMTHPIGSFGFGTDFAACVLTEPVTDVPITPPLMGCDAEAKLVVGESATIVGFGQSDDPEQPVGVKREVTTEIGGFSWDEVFVGDEDKGACYGDSGGPVLTQLSDGTWRVFGVTSWGQPGSGAGYYLSLVHRGVEWVEDATGIDVTPCHDALGAWDPSPACGGFAFGEPGQAQGSWDSCTWGQVSELSSTCGPAFDPSTDDIAPTLAIIDPQDGARFNSPDNELLLDIVVDVEDVGWGTDKVIMKVVDGGEVLFQTEDGTAPFVFPAFIFTSGVWTIEAEAVDRAGNVGFSEPVTFGVNTDPPAPAETSGESSSGTGDGDTDIASSSGEGTSGTQTGDDSGTEATGSVVDEDGGCACRTSSGGTGGGAMVTFFALLGATGWRRRRRRRAGLAASAGMFLLLGCGETSVVETDTNTGEVSTSGSMSESGSTPSSTGESDATSADSSDGETSGEEMTTDADPCGNGEIDGDELCDDGNQIIGDGCNNDCVPSGTEVWREYVPGVGSVSVNALDLDATGNILAAGYSGPVSSEVTAWVAKFSPEGTMIWEHNHAIDGGNAGYYDLAHNGDTIIAVGWAEVDTRDSLLAAFDPDGKAISIDQHSLAMDDDYLVDVAVADDLRVTLGFQGQDRQPVVTAFNSGGDIVWTFAEPNVVGGSLARTQDGHTLAAFGQPTSPQTQALLLNKLDDNGESAWVRTISDPLTNYYASDIFVASEGDAVICGELTRTDASDTLLVAVDAAGNERWKERYPVPGPGYDWCSKAVFTEDAIAFIGRGYTQNHGWEVYLGKVAPDTGAPLWTRTFGGEGVEFDFGGAIMGLPGGELIVGATLDVDGHHRTLLRLTP